MANMIQAVLGWFGVRYLTRQERDREENEKIERHFAAQEFARIFGFSPIGLEQAYLRKECLVRLAMLAVATKDALGQSDYEYAASRYLVAVELIQKFDPDFGSSLPHWSDFQAYLDGLLAAKNWTMTPETDPGPRKSACYRMN